MFFLILIQKILSMIIKTEIITFFSSEASPTQFLEIVIDN